jgi:hypothetical protein
MNLWGKTLQNLHKSIKKYYRHHRLGRPDSHISFNIISCDSESGLSSCIQTE